MISLEQLIPDLSTMLRREDPVIFCPLHFLDLVMGYCAFQTDISHDSYEKINSFMNAMNSSLGIFHSQVHTKSINMQLKSANSELEKLYVHDHMTGLLNRRGFYRQFHQQLKESSGKNMSIVIISADLDGLKHINDTFGHTEGDNAITTVGKALVSSAIQGEVCSRFGGDEFTVAGVIADSDSCYFDSFRFRFREYLHRYNSISHKPYQVESSIGFCIQPMDKNVDLDQMIKSQTTECTKTKSSAERHENKGGDTMRNSNSASIALLYQNRTELEQFIQEYCLPARREDSSWLVMIHTSCHTPEGAVAIAKHVSELLPDAKILGTSASAVIYHAVYTRTAVC